ncbi:hypothetical protein, partial [Klebsiella pneumoniae]
MLAWRLASCLAKLRSLLCSSYLWTTVRISGLP